MVSTQVRQSEGPRFKSSHYRCISGIRLRLQWKLRTLDKPFGFLVLKPFRNYLVNWGYMAGIGIRIIDLSG